MYKMLEQLKSVVLFTSLLIHAGVDWKKQQIYRSVLVITAIAGIFFHIFLQEQSVFMLIGGAMIGGILLVCGFFTRERIGYGDGWLFVSTGLFLGFWDNLSLLFTASVLAGIFAAMSCLLKRKGRNDRIPFAPFVFVAYVVIFIGGRATGIE